MTNSLTTKLLNATDSSINFRLSLDLSGSLLSNFNTTHVLRRNGLATLNLTSQNLHGIEDSLVTLGPRRTELATEDALD